MATVWKSEDLSGFSASEPARRVSVDRSRPDRAPTRDHPPQVIRGFLVAMPIALVLWIALAGTTALML